MEAKNAALVAALAVLVMVARAEIMAMEICNIDADQLASCMPAIRGGATEAPSSACCAALSAADLPCLCRYKGNVILKSVGIDPGLAAALPTKCGMAAPPECKGNVWFSLSQPLFHILSVTLSLRPRLLSLSAPLPLRLNLVLFTSLFPTPSHPHTYISLSHPLRCPASRSVSLSNSISSSLSLLLSTSISYFRLLSSLCLIF